MQIGYHIRSAATSMIFSSKHSKIGSPGPGLYSARIFLGRDLTSPAGAGRSCTFNEGRPEAAPSAPPDSSLVCLSDHYFGNLHNFQCPRKDVGVTRRPPPRNFTDVGAAIGRREGGGSRRPLTWSDLYRYIKAAIGIRRQPPPPAWGCRRARRRVRRCYYVWR